MVAAQSVGRDRCGPASLVSRASDVTRHMENAQRGVLASTPPEESRSTARVPTPTFESGQQRMKLRASDHSEDACRRRMLDAGRCNQGGMAWRALVSRHGDICTLPATAPISYSKVSLQPWCNAWCSLRYLYSVCTLSAHMSA